MSAKPINPYITFTDPGLRARGLDALGKMQTRAVEPEPEPKQFWMAEVGAWSVGSGSAGTVCGAGESYKQCNAFQLSLEPRVPKRAPKSSRCLEPELEISVPTPQRCCRADSMKNVRRWFLTENDEFLWILTILSWPEKAYRHFREQSFAHTGAAEA